MRKETEPYECTKTSLLEKGCSLVVEDGEGLNIPLGLEYEYVIFYQLQQLPLKVILSSSLTFLNLIKYLFKHHQYRIAKLRNLEM